MKKLFLFFAIAICAFISNAQVKMPAPSPTQILKQDFGIGSIEITYSRPSAKGRKVFGDLVPMGKLWRTGANAATKVVLNEPIEIGGKKVDSGTYVLYTIPNENSWDIIINKGLQNWGIDGYKETEDVARFTVDAVKTTTATETFTMQFEDVKTQSCKLVLSWENKNVVIPIKVNLTDKLRMKIEEALAKAEKKPYWQAAQFYNEYDKNLPKALENISKAVEANPKAYWVMLYKAKIQKEMGDVKGAMETSKQSQALAKEEGNDDYVKMNQDLQKQLSMQE